MRTSKYDPLRDYLRSRRDVEVELSLEEIEEILGFDLGTSAERPNWWANSRSLAGRAQRRAWAHADYDAFPRLRDRIIVFRRRDLEGVSPPGTTRQRPPRGPRALS